MSKEYQNMPLLSVIIPTVNRAKYIERCLVSVFKEIETNYRNTEVIVIDGGSSDGTLEILKKYDHRITYWTSEPDSGVSEAVNKGLAKSSGDIIRFIGDDDELMPRRLEYMVRYLVEHPEIDVLIGHSDTYSQDEFGIIEPLSCKQPVGRITYKDFFQVNEIGWPAPENQFTWRWVFERYGGYDTRYRYLGCFEIWLRHARSGINFEVLPVAVTRRYLTPDSGNVKIGPAGFTGEFNDILTAYGSLWWKLSSYYPRRIKVNVLNSPVSLCEFLNVHPLRALRRIKRVWTEP
jgi:glycosyltransferase involved in cell wall biosynthesis